MHRAVTGHEAQATLRIDKWLWFARFFKSRSQATDAVAGGLVHVNGERVKAARELRVGDRLTITCGEMRFEVTVADMLVRRGPAVEAQRAYTESAESIAERARKREHARLAPPAPFGRPGKHDRRALRALRGR